MKISTIKYIESLPGYGRELDSVIDAATLAGIGHDRYNPAFTPTTEQVNACITYLDRAINDSFDSTLALFFTDKSEAELRAERSRNFDHVRSLLNQLERHITVGGR